MVAQFAESLRTKVAEFMVLPVSPDVLHGIKLGSIGRQILGDAASPNLRVSPTMLEAAKLAVELAA